MPITDDLGRALSVWSWEGIEFPGEDASTTYGHDSVQHKGFGQRGANIETTGPKPLVTKVRAALVNGLRGWRGPALFPDTWERLTRSLTTTPEGFLSHPTRGLFTAHFDEATEEIKVRERRGLFITLSFTEQNGEADVLTFAPTDAAPAAAALASSIEVDALRPAGARVTSSLAAEVSAALDFLETSTRTVAQATARFDGLLASIEARASDPAAVASTAHAFRAALYATRGAILRYRAKYLGSGRRFFVVDDSTSLARIAANPLVYGDASRAPDLARANTVLDPSRVAAGTRLVVID
jgi:DNA circularisation protein N-terminus